MELSAGFRRERPPHDADPADPAAVARSEALAARIRHEIVALGPMTFARFMELALYDPEAGYYRAPETRPGRAGDFLTAPEAHPIFGRALARQLVEVWQRLDRPARFVIREYGAGSGALAEAILRGLAADRSDLLGALRYVAIDVDARRSAEIADRLEAAGHADARARADEPAGPGVVLANEVLDALPVHRVVVREGRLLERYVTAVDDAFVEHAGPPSTGRLAERLAAESIELAEGQSAEVCLALEGWIAEVARPLERGLLLLIDYGAPAADLYDPVRRPDGTIRAFRAHRQVPDVYRDVGLQDLTAHVDFTAVERAARAAGLMTIGATSQAEFLAGAGIEDMLRAVQADPATTLQEYVELRSALMRLLDPAAMGGYRVAGFGRDWPDGPAIAGFAYRLPGR